MFKKGDLVKRVKILSVTDEDYEWVVDENIENDFGIVLDVETPKYDVMVSHMEYPECFVKVLWQKNDWGPMWHWAEELKVIKNNKK